MRHTYLIFEFFYWFNGCDTYIYGDTKDKIAGR